MSSSLLSALGAENFRGCSILVELSILLKVQVSVAAHCELRTAARAFWSGGIVIILWIHRRLINFERWSGGFCATRRGNMLSVLALSALASHGAGVRRHGNVSFVFMMVSCSLLQPCSYELVSTLYWMVELQLYLRSSLLSQAG